MATKKPRVMVTLDDETMAMVIEFQNANGYPDRSMAMHELIMLGLAAMEKEEADPTPKIHRRTKPGGDPDEA